MAALNAVLCAMVACVVACAAPPPAPESKAEPDSTRALWGDENAGLTSDIVDSAAHGSHAALEWYHAATSRVSLRANNAVADVHARAVDGRAAASLAWHAHGVVREVVAGSLRFDAGEGALLADTRSATLTSVRTPGTGGLRLTPTALVWGTGVGAGVVLQPGPLRVTLAGWRLRDEPSSRHTWSSCEWRRAGTVLGVVAGLNQAHPRRRLAGGSAYAGVGLAAAWLSGEVAAIPLVRADSLDDAHALRAVVRATAGEHGEWRAAVAGGTLARDGVATAVSATSAVVERHGVHGAFAGRARLLFSTQRDGDGATQRRRVDIGSTWRLSERVALEGAIRVTRDDEVDAGATPFVFAPPRERREEIRSRMGLRTRHDVSGARISNDYRVELVDDRRAGVGLVGTWSIGVDAGPIAWRLRAAATALREGQVAYVSNDGVSGASAFSVLSGTGASSGGPEGAGVVTSLRARVTRHGSVGAQVIRPRDGPGRAEFFAGAGW